MTITNPIRGLQTRSAPSTSGPNIVFVGALTAVVTAAAVLDQSLPRDQLVPMISTMLFALAAGVALIAWLRPIPSRCPSYWDVAGGLTFIGICIAALIEPEQMVRLVTEVDRKP
jgi:hypothetical protein